MKDTMNDSSPRPILSPGIGIAILFITVGAFFYAMASTMSRDAGFTLKLFIAGPPLLLSGISMLIIPPKLNLPSKFDEDTDIANQFDFFTENKKWKIAIWIGAALVGIIFNKFFINIFSF